ncbi:Cytochrome P450 4d8, partial [Leucoagaricus sp. SymC.cos]
YRLWGMNLIGADGDIWRKHRRIMGPAFGNSLYEYVWKESVQTFKEMVSSDGWLNKKSVEVPAVQRITFKVWSLPLDSIPIPESSLPRSQYTLFIIGKCAFGLPFTWSEPPTAPDGTMSLQEALRLSNETFLTRVLTPKWAFKLPIASLRRAKQVNDQLSGFMHQQIEERRQEVRDGTIKRDDVFTRLVQANEDEESKYRLADDELIGNVFVMLFAGHETTAHTLAATLGILAYYPEIQEEVYEHIISVIGKTRDPVWDAFNKLEKVVAVFFESLRLFPSGFVMIREAREDTILTIPNEDGMEGTRTIPVSKGTEVIVDMIGVQYNPRYFDEPGKFKPSRWYGVPADSEMFTAFSIGPRACLGRKFGMTESVAFLTLLLRDWRVEPLLSAGETREQWGERVLDAEFKITLGVASMPIRLTRRD